ncbi:hypothetical protein ACN38_g2620 [Penicillium nordicum]|uniref:Uncharacterized protein n=1 Tax=Penicillium nordicum TaxID=229535 RepID=A0A0M8P706_9EURO|nr:hypothetical protein ACN38_g2620 [Penicillium nordicum]
MQLYRKYRLWRPTAFECDMRFPAAWPCSLLCPTWMCIDPQPPCSASLLPRLKTSLGRLRSDLCADKGLRLTTQLSS